MPPPFKPFERLSFNRERFRQNVWVLGTKIVLHKTVGYLGRKRSIVEIADDSHIKGFAKPQFRKEIVSRVWKNAKTISSPAAAALAAGPSPRDQAWLWL